MTFVVNEATTDLNGVKLQRLMPDPANGNPDANFFQRIQGLMNITSPTAGGKDASLLHPSACQQKWSCSGDTGCAIRSHAYLAGSEMRRMVNALSVSV